MRLPRRLAAEGGWREQSTGEPPDCDAVSSVASPFTYDLELMGPVDPHGHGRAGVVTRLCS